MKKKELARNFQISFFGKTRDHVVERGTTIT